MSAALVAIFYRSKPADATASPVERPRLSELGGFLRRPPILVVFGCGLALSIAQSSLLAYLVLYAKDSFDVSAVRAAQILAIAQVGGTVSRVLWGVASDRSFGGRRRPGVVARGAIGSEAYANLALGSQLTEWLG